MSEDNDDETPRRRPSPEESRRHFERHPPGTPVVRSKLQTANARDLESERRRRAERKSYPYGVPVPQDDEATDPFALMGPVPDVRDIEAVRRAGRETDSPIKSIEFAQAIRLVKEQLREERRSAEAAQYTQLETLLNRPPREVATQLSDDVATLMEAYKTGRKTLTKLLIWIAIAAVGSLGTGLGLIWDRSSNETTARLRLEYLQQQVDRIDKRIETQVDRIDKRIEQIVEREYLGTPPPFPTTKGQNHP